MDKPLTKLTLEEAMVSLSTVTDENGEPLKMPFKVNPKFLDGLEHRGRERFRTGWKDWRGMKNKPNRYLAVFLGQLAKEVGLFCDGIKKVFRG